jgi:hypothetical protein
MTGSARHGRAPVPSTPSGSEAPGAATVRPAPDEPTLDQLLAEPIVQQLMRRDKIDEATTRRLMQQVMAARSAPKPHYIGSRGYAEDDANSSVPRAAMSRPSKPR